MGVRERMIAFASFCFAAVIINIIYWSIMLAGDNDENQPVGKLPILFVSIIINFLKLFSDSLWIYYFSLALKS